MSQLSLEPLHRFHPYCARFPMPPWRRPSAGNEPWSASGPHAFSPSAWMAWQTPLAAAPRAVFPPEVALPVVRLACARPDRLGRRRSPGDGHERARQRIAAEIVEDIAASTVRRMLAAHQLQPWRHQLWRPPRQPRDATCSAPMLERLALDTRPLRDDELVRSVEEKTSRQPRPRLALTLPAQPRNIPNRHEHEYRGAGALHRFAAFATRSGRVDGQGDARTRQQECSAFRDAFDQQLAAHRRTMHLVGDHGSPPHGNEVSRWFAHHPRVVVHCPSGHGAWRHHVDQGVSLLQRKR